MSNAISIRAKLYNLAKEKGIDFQNIAIRYFHERILYRISLSTYKDNLWLKGGNWIYATQDIYSRPTTDIDVLAQAMNNDEAMVASIFKEILSLDAEDGISFMLHEIKSSIIAEQRQYHGIRLTLIANLDTIRQSIMIDVGFGDVVTPAPIQIDFPVLLHTMPVPNLWAYNAETVIAEKFHAMVSLGSINSRMKDVFDIYTILMTYTLDRENLRNAIIATFEIRNTPLDSDAIIFTMDYRNDPNKEKQWQQYHKKLKMKNDVSFAQVIDFIALKLKIFLE